MAQLHELLAAEKTPMAAWHTLREETLKKMSNEKTYFSGHSKSLKMIEESAANAAVEAQAREEKAVASTVGETLEYMLDIWGKFEDLQYQKNKTNQRAVGTVVFGGKEILQDMPVDQLLGLEARLVKIREIFAAMPTLDASKHWEPAAGMGTGVWQIKYPEEGIKTEKTVVPIVMAQATQQHPAQIQASTRDAVVGKFTTIVRSGAVTAQQKADAIKNIDELAVQVKQARMRANMTPVEPGKISKALVDVLMDAFK